jgi:hypothetical protein
MNKVFGIGLSRTGTASLNQALTLLGYCAVHYPADKTTQDEYYAYFASPSETIHLTVLKYWDAITDTPACCIFEVLDKSYPDSKFILTIREKEAWLHSCERYWKEMLIPMIQSDPDHPDNRYIRFINKRLYGIEDFDREVFSSVYDTYNNKVMQHFRERKGALLLLNICAGEGWDKLVPFLGIPFPHENRAQDIQDKKQSDTGNASER